MTETVNGLAMGTLYFPQEELSNSDEQSQINLQRQIVKNPASLLPLTAYFITVRSSDREDNRASQTKESHNTRFPHRFSAST